MEVQIGTKIGCQMGRKNASRMDVQIGAKMGYQMGGQGSQNRYPNWCRNGEPNGMKKASKLDPRVGSSLDTSLMSDLF